MGIEMLLALAALAVAVVGTANDDFSRRTKHLLIAAASVTCIGTILKAVYNERENNFMRAALISTLSPSNSQYNRIVEEIGDFAGKQKLDLNICHHGSDGMACLLISHNDGNKHSTLVFNKSEISQMYAHLIESRHNERLIKDSFAQQYSSSTDWDEEFVDKVGILGGAVCFNMFHRFATGYNYDPSFGLKVDCEASTGNMEVQITTDELSKFHNGIAPQVFYNVEQRFRELYKGREGAGIGHEGTADSQRKVN